MMFWDVIHRKGVGLLSIAGEQGMVFSMVFWFADLQFQLARGSDKTADETEEVAADLQALKLKNSLFGLGDLCWIPWT